LIFSPHNLSPLHSESPSTISSFMTFDVSPQID
jgi:hypothetical protein